jgi:hypothetical protein
MSVSLAIVYTLITGVVLLVALAALLLFVDGEQEISDEWFWDENDGDL